MDTMQTKITENVRLSRFLKFCGGTSYIKSLGSGASGLAQKYKPYAQCIEAFIAGDQFRLSRLQVVKGTFKSTFNAPPEEQGVVFALINPFGSSSSSDAEEFAAVSNEIFESDEFRNENDIEYQASLGGGDGFSGKPISYVTLAPKPGQGVNV